MAHATTSSWVRYLVVWIALLALTALTFLLSLAHLGEADVAIALVIATIKTTLVALFFMHLVEERFSVVLAPAVALFLFLLLVGLTVVDVVTRRTFPRAPTPSVDIVPGSVE
jgi:cytochrome c oxidase subunit 4